MTFTTPVIEDSRRLAPTLAARGNGEEGSGGRLGSAATSSLRRSWLLSSAY